MKDQSAQRSRNASIPQMPSNDSPGKLLHDAHLRLSSGFVEALRQTGHQFTIDTWAVLNLLWEKDNIPQFEIGEQIGRDRHQTSRLIDSLTEQGFVARKSIAGDRRVKRVVLTRKGRTSRTELKQVATDYLEHTFTGVAQADFDSFILCLQHIVNRRSPTNEKKEIS